MPNVPFTRERAAAHVDAMVAWFLGLSGDTAGRVTDLNIGSNIRTLLETVALRLEVLDNKVYQGMRRLIPTVLYEWFGEGDGSTTTVGFPALPPLPATGAGRFTFDPASGGSTITIPAGTRLVAPRRSQLQPATYRTTAPVTFVGGVVDAVIVCDLTGAAGDAQANTLTLLDAVPGVLSATNPARLTGRAAETEEARRLRFVAYLRNLARAQLGGLEVGALTARLLVAGVVTERVLFARAVPVADKLGRVTVYVDNGGGTASAALVAECQRTLDGYIDFSGTRVIGYAAAGVVVTARAVTPQPEPVTVAVRLDGGYRFADVAVAVDAAVADYLDGLGVFGDLVFSELVGVIAAVPGVADHTLSAPTGNVAANAGSRIMPGTITVTEA